MFTGNFCIFDIKKAEWFLKSTGMFLIIYAGMLGGILRDSILPSKSWRRECLFFVYVACSRMKMIVGACCLEGNKKR